jgi:hypothetical protein
MYVENGKARNFECNVSFKKQQKNIHKLQFITVHIRFKQMTGIGTKKCFSLMKKPVRLQFVVPITYIYLLRYTLISAIVQHLNCSPGHHRILLMSDM